MSVYYSKYDLNTYKNTPYFQAQLPVGYPVELIMQKCRAFRRLPPNLQELSRLARRWSDGVNGSPPDDQGIRLYYDDDGYELDPDTGRRLTDVQIDAQWKPDPSLDEVRSIDVPLPDEGLPNPDTWKPDEEGAPTVDDDRPTPEQIQRDIDDRGIDAAIEEYGHKAVASITENQFCPGSNKDATCSPGDVSEKAARSKAAYVAVNREEQRYAEEYNEPRLAKILKGKSLPDGEPNDIETDKHLIEMKTLLYNGNDKLTMDSFSQIRKIVKERETGKTFHTIVSDDRDVFNAKGEGEHDDSRRVYYYRRGVAGSARIGNMYKVEGGEKELKRLLDMDEKDLPDAAQRTDGKHRVGTWKPVVDEETGRKGFINRKTGVDIKAKK